MVLVRKWPILQLFFFRQYRQGKCLLRYSRTKKRPFQIIKRRSSRRRKIDFFPKGLTHGFAPKMADFQTFFLQAIQARKMSFTILYNEKTPYQAINTRSLKSRKIDVFPKWLTDDFGPKMPIFPFFFLGNRCQENVFYDILERENAFLDYKKKNFKKSKN